jgi:hypothetical protein
MAAQTWLGGDHQGGRREEGQGAVAHLREHVGIAAELVGREDQHLDAAVGLLGDPVGRLLGADVERMAQGQVVAVAQGDLGGLGVARNREQGHGGGCGPEALEKRPSADRHDVFPPSMTFCSFLIKKLIIHMMWSNRFFDGF